MYLNKMNGNHDYIQMQRIQSKHGDLWKSYPVQNSDSKSRDERGANLNARNQLLSQSLPCLGLLWNATRPQLSLITDILLYNQIIQKPWNDLDQIWPQDIDSMQYIQKHLTADFDKYIDDMPGQK